MVKEVKFAVLVEDTIGMNRPDLLAKHGVSFFVKAKTSDGEASIMMDTGSSPILLHNVDKMDVALRKIEVKMEDLLKILCLMTKRLSSTLRARD